MRGPLQPCGGCKRHIRADEAKCPFCRAKVVASSLPPLPSLGLSRAGQLAWMVLFGATASGCDLARVDEAPVGSARLASASSPGAATAPTAPAPPAAVTDAGASASEEVEFPLIAFALRSVVPSATAGATLKQIAAALAAHPDHTIKLSGHADPREKPKELRLSSFRARRVRDALVALGVPAEKVTLYAYGDDRPSEETQPIGTPNRRVEAVLIPPPRPPRPGADRAVPVYGAPGFMPVAGFGVGSATLSPALSRSLEGVAEVLLAQPRLVVEIGGHADPSEPARERLSELRARAALKYLVELGVPEERLTAKGDGSKVDMSSMGADGPARNRSVGFRIVQGAP